MNQNETIFEKQDIFKKRENILPYEYPELLEYKKAIRHSYWLESEFNFTSDINDFKIKVNDSEREAIKRTMLAIAQIEVKVKTFWADMYKRMPKTEIGDVGMTFAESEVRHKDAYAELLNVLGLQKAFETLIEVPAIKNRINYLTKYLDGTRSKDNKMYTKSVLLFSLFIEHVSLFSQFLIMMSFNK
jgi:ribonucleoside-diphosphate reductase beta chain